MIELQQILAAIAAFAAVLITGLLIDRRDRVSIPVDEGGVGDADATAAAIISASQPRSPRPEASCHMGNHSLAW